MTLFVNNTIDEKTADWSLVEPYQYPLYITVAVAQN